MVAMEFAASFMPFMKSNSSAAATNEIRRRSGTVGSALGLFDGDAADAVGNVLEAVHHPLEVIVDVVADHVVHGVAVAMLEIERFHAMVVEIVGALLQSDD